MSSEPESSMRLQRFLARCGVASRRASEAIIAEGRVRVNGEVATELGTKVDPASDRVEVDGALLHLPHDDVVIMLHKPVGYVTTMVDPQGRPTVASLVPVADYPSLFPLGRLDKDTSGLLLFSTDGDLGHELLHPSRHVDKTYRAKVAGSLSLRDIERLEEGIELEDGMTAPARCQVIATNRDASVVELTIHEGRKRQVRRMFDALGHPVIDLERITFGPLSLDGLDSGRWRELTAEECAHLRASITPR